ncbi:motility twitching protein PilT [Fibrobacterales bacterium]|nr:motility twitching protein PilT [Fibrobacterales bacterium]
MESRFLLDTNVVIDFMSGQFPITVQQCLFDIINKGVNLSAINKMELLGFANVGQQMIDFVSYASIVPIDNAVINKTIDIRRIYKIKLHDAIVAATAIVHNFVIVTRNVKDFKNISNIEIKNPWDI